MMKKTEKVNKILYTLIFTFFTMLIFVMAINEQNMSFYQNESWLYQFVMGISLSIKEFDVMYVALGVFVFYTYYHIYFDGSKLNRDSFINSIISVILTFVVIIGKSYKIDNSLGTIFNTPAQVFKCVCLGLGYYFVFYALFKKLNSIRIEKKVKKKSPKWEKIINKIDKYHILIAIVVILLCWLPYIIFYFPGASTGDTFDSLSQFFHQDNSWSIKTINLINDNVYINKHHPPLFTCVLGLIFKLGKYFGSFTIGAFIYTILQVSLLIVIFCFMFHYMKKNGIPLMWRIFSILFVAMTPVIGAYAISAVKDTISAILTLLYVIFLLEIIRNYDSFMKNKGKVIFLIILMILVMMFRNNGIFTILLSFPFLLLIYKDKWKKIVMILVVCLSVFGLYDKVLLPSLDVTDGSIKEVLTIPFMQLARVVHFNSEVFSEDEIARINKVISYNSMKTEYSPNLADSVKDTFNKNATDEEIKDFFGIWWKYFKKYPFVYIESVINSTYGYFFPEVGEEYAKLAVDARVGKGTYINISAVESFKDDRSILHTINQILAKLPIVSLFNHVAFYDWFLIFSCLYIIKKKRYRYLIALAPLLSVLLVCLASPINGSFRYILPIVFAVPIIFTVDYFTFKET